MGIAAQLSTAIVGAGYGISEEEAMKLFWLMDKCDGLLIDRDRMGTSFDDTQEEFARPGDKPFGEGEIPVLMVIKCTRPTVLNQLVRNKIFNSIL